MKTFIKISLTVIACCGLCTSAMAANRFIVKYKTVGTPSQEQLDALSKAAAAIVADVKASCRNTLGTGAQVIILSKKLDRKQIEQFISSVKQDKSIAYIEEDRIMQTTEEKPNENRVEANYRNNRFIVSFRTAGKPSLEQLDALSKAASVVVTDVKATYRNTLGIGAHVITLSKDLDKKQTDQFINNVKQDKNIEYIEEEGEAKAF